MCNVVTPGRPVNQDTSAHEVIRRVRKGLNTARHQGLRTLARDAVYSFYYHRYQRQRALRASLTGSSDTRVTLWDKEFELAPQGLGISEELRCFGVHEPLATSIYQSLLRSVEHVVDVGANVGYYLRAAAEIVGETGRYLAFEPVPDNYDILTRNVERAMSGVCETFPCALGSTNETTVFYESHASNLGGLLRHPRQQLKKKISVAVRRLDDVLASVQGFRPTVLRMDVEGAELLVLAGAQQVLHHYKPMLFIEFHPCVIGIDAVTTAVRELSAVGYEDGVLIDRCWDQPWIASWARKRRSWKGNLSGILDRLTTHARELPVFALIVRRPTS